MSIIKNLVTISFLLYTTCNTWATPASPYPFFRTSQTSSEFCLEVIPIYKSNTEQAHIRCYGLHQDEGGNIQRKQIWQVEREYCYPHDIFLSNDGNAMVCLSFAPLENTTLNDLKCIDFYWAGKHVRSIQLKELVDVKSLQTFTYEGRKCIQFSDEEGDKRGLAFLSHLKTENLNIAILPNDSKERELFYLTIQGYTYFYTINDGKLSAKIAQIPPIK